MMFNGNDLELLSAYLDGALTDEDRAALEARLQADADLRRELARLRATVELIHALPPLTAPRDFTLTRQTARRPVIWLSTAFSAASAAAAVILLVIGGLLLTTSANQPLAAPSAAESIASLPTATVTSAREVGQNDLLQGSALSDAAAASAESATASLKQATESSTAAAAGVLRSAIPAPRPLRRTSSLRRVMPRPPRTLPPFRRSPRLRRR